MRTVHEVSKLTGISVRTLHHYDAIGLLKPTSVSAAGYRLYDDAALERLRSILLYRELQFSLKDIKAILDSPSFDAEEALSQQIELLEMQHRRIGELIAFAREIQKRGVHAMDFQVFDRNEMEQYREEAKARWGDTAAYAEYARKGSRDFGATAGQMMELFAQLGTLRSLTPEANEVQQKIRALQEFITKNFYTCTKEILRGLGQMYVQDDRFRANIDRAGGEGTAEFAMRAIEYYCNRK